MECTQYYDKLNPSLDMAEDDDYSSYEPDNYYEDTNWERGTWYAMTDGMYGDMPEGFDGDYDFLGY